MGAKLTYVGGFSADLAARVAEQAKTSLKNEAIRALNSSGNKMVNDAVTRRNKAFNTDTGRSAESIKYDVEVRSDSASLTFYVDPSNVTLSSGYNLTWMLNDLTYGNYARGAISPTAQTVGGDAGTGLKPKNGINRGRDFMGKAWNLEVPKLDEKLKKILKEAVIKVG